MQKLKANYVVIPGLVLLIAGLGKWFSQEGMIWYRTLTLPTFTPPAWFFSIMWQVIYLLTTICLILIWNAFKRDHLFYSIKALFVANAMLNVGWTYLFFYKHNIWLALWVCIALDVTIWALFVLIWQRSKEWALLLLPYGLWVAFASYLNYKIWLLNQPTSFFHFLMI